MTDLDKLHDVFLHNFVVDKQCGKTYATCFELLGAVELGDENIYYLTNFYGSMNYVIQMFLDIILESGYSFKQISRDTFRVLHSKIRFITKDNAENILRGLDNYTIVEMEI